MRCLVELAARTAGAAGEVRMGCYRFQAPVDVPQAGQEPGVTAALPDRFGQFIRVGQGQVILWWHLP